MSGRNINRRTRYSAKIKQSLNVGHALLNSAHSVDIRGYYYDELYEILKATMKRIHIDVEGVNWDC